MGESLLQLWQTARGWLTQFLASLSPQQKSFLFRGGPVLVVGLFVGWYLLQRIAYRLENDSTDGVTHAWDITAGLQYLVGDLATELTIEYDRLDLPEAKEDDFGLYLRVRREFPSVFGLH